MKLFCPNCFSSKFTKEGFSANGNQRYKCKKCNYKTAHLLKNDDVGLAKSNKDLAKSLLSEKKKQCSKCFKIKPLDMFYKRKTKKDGYRHRCIECHKQYRRENKDKISKQKKEYRLKNKDKIKEYRVKYYLNNKDEIRRISDKWLLENKERYAEWRKEYTLKNKDKIAEYKREYREKNKEIIREKQKEYRLKNKDRLAKNLKEYYYKNKDIYKENGAKYYSENKVEILRKQKIYFKGQSENLTDNYISQLLTRENNLSREDIPRWLIDAKRQQIKLQRIIGEEK
jgi:transposase-like protein